MSSATITYPLLVSELPPTSLAGRVSRRSVRSARRSALRDAARFEQSLLRASPAERIDLLHAARRR
jgi:hypothetical protein